MWGTHFILMTVRLSNGRQYMAVWKLPCSIHRLTYQCILWKSWTSTDWFIGWCSTHFTHLLIVSHHMTNYTGTSIFITNGAVVLAAVSLSLVSFNSTISAPLTGYTRGSQSSAMHKNAMGLGSTHIWCRWKFPTIIYWLFQITINGQWCSVSEFDLFYILYSQYIGLIRAHHFGCPKNIITAGSKIML